MKVYNIMLHICEPRVFNKFITVCNYSPCLCSDEYNINYIIGYICKLMVFNNYIHYKVQLITLLLQ